MATKATATNEQWEADGIECGLQMNNQELPDFLKKQIAMSLKKYSNRSDRQAKAWMKGYNSVACI